MNDDGLQASVQNAAEQRTLGGALAAIGDYDLIAHWKQGEFHHDVLVRAHHWTPTARIALIATNCNGRVKEVMAFASMPDRSALWHWRCHESPEFSGELPEISARATMEHFFDPCEVLRPDARSELRPEHRGRQAGGGWKACTGTVSCSLGEKR